MCFFLITKAISRSGHTGQIKCALLILLLSESSRLTGELLFSFSFAFASLSSPAQCARPRPRHAVFIVQAARHPQTAVACSPTVLPLHAHLRGVKISPHREFRPSRDRPAGPGARAFSISFSRRPRLTLPRRHPRSAAFPCTSLSHGARAASVFLESSDVVLFIFSSSVPTGSFL